MINLNKNGSSTKTNSLFIDGLAQTCKDSIEGDFFDIGCWTGTISFYAAMYFKNNNINKKIYMLDTFDGHPTEQIQHIDKSWGFPLHEFKNVSIQNIENTFKDIGFSNYEIVKGDVIETLKHFKNHKMSFVSMDLNHYVPTKFVLNFLYEQNFKGIIFEDDYDNIEGITQCYNEATNLKYIKHPNIPVGGYFSYNYSKINYNGI